MDPYCAVLENLSWIFALEEILKLFMRMFFTVLGLLSLKETEQVFFNIVHFSGGYLLPAAHCPEIDKGSGAQTLHHKSDLEFGFEILQRGIIN